MPRYRLLVEYDGRSFAGWQHQDDLETVQGTLETALAAVDGGPRRAFAAGRTDAGVHATGQVVHADLEKVWRAFRSRLMPTPCTPRLKDWSASTTSRRFATPSASPTVR